MEYGILEGFAEKLDGINRVGNGAKIQSVKLNDRIERLNNIVGDGVVIEHFIEGTKGKYFYINMKDVRAKLRVEDQKDIAEYMIFALITEDGEHIFDINSIETARNLFRKFIKQMGWMKKLGLLFLGVFIIIILLAPPIAWLILIPFLLLFLVAKIPQIINYFFSKKTFKGTLDAIKIQYDRMEPSRLKEFLLSNGFSFI